MECSNIPKEASDLIESLTSENLRLKNRISHLEERAILFERLYLDSSDMIRQLSLRLARH